jgi:hypothetical protein
MSPTHRKQQRDVSNYARVAGASSSGVLEIAIFHPFDTAAKRLMSHTSPVFTKHRPLTESWNVAIQVVFKEHANSGARVRWKSMMQGLEAALGYKVAQRSYRFAGQPICSEFIDRHYGGKFEEMFGRKYCKPMMHALCGAFVGVGEISIVPLDVLKIKRQTNPEAVRGRGLISLIRSEGWGLYNGATWTAARNAPGSFALFGGAALAKDVLFELEDYNDATMYQNFVASIAGAVSCIFCSNPFDVIKTRVQNKNFGEHVSGVDIFKDLLRMEGPGAFFKGFLPKLAIVGPKLIFAFTATQTLIGWFERVV